MLLARHCGQLSAFAASAMMPNTIGTDPTVSAATAAMPNQPPAESVDATMLPTEAQSNIDRMWNTSINQMQQGFDLFGVHDHHVDAS